ncbi:hypothetical protein LIER_11852 [Lithospermum erythrorhizon]|uniref:Uncharacterized protein n=1 Tax=Lithospermum erythrorhizon TaxID=34254 RepID=A0AAV3PPL8_LITER
MSGNNVQVNNETHIPSLSNLPNEQNIPQYPPDVKTEIQRRVNERWERKRERTIQSSRYTHHSRDRNMSENSEAHSAQHNPQERRHRATTVPMAEPATQSYDATQKLQKELQEMTEMIKALNPIVASSRACKTKMSFTDILDAVPLPKGFVLPQYT